MLYRCVSAMSHVELAYMARTIKNPNGTYQIVKFDCLHWARIDINVYVSTWHSTGRTGTLEYNSRTGNMCMYERSLDRLHYLGCLCDVLASNADTDSLRLMDICLR